jgi:hypothetical protein
MLSCPATGTTRISAIFGAPLVASSAIRLVTISPSAQPLRHDRLRPPRGPHISGTPKEQQAQESS